MKRSAQVFALVSIALLGALTACGGGDKNNNPDGGQGDPCASAAQCSTGFVCAAGTCALEGSVGLGGGCSATRDCATSLYCTEVGVCGPAGNGQTGASCSTGADCAKGLACELSGFEGVCVAAGTGDLGASCGATHDCLAGLVCGTNGKCDRVTDAYPPFAGVQCVPPESPFRIYWQVPRPNARLADFYRLPFPNDARVNDDGTLDLSDFPRPGKSILGVDLVDLYATALSQDFDGFSTIAPVTFRFSSELDFKTTGSGTDSGANIHYVDITDPAAGTFGNDRGRNFGYDTGAHPFLCQNALVVGNNPEDPLEPGHTYAVYVTTKILSKSGTAPSIDPDLTAVLATTQPTDPVLAKVWTKYANFRAYLTKKGLTPNDIAGVAVLTAQDPTAKAKKLAAAVLGTPVPALEDVTLCEDATTASPCASDADRKCGAPSAAYYEILGRFTEPRWQQGTEPYETPADKGQIDFTGGNPVQNGTEDVCFDLTIPKSAMPAGGWPLVVHAHGTGGGFKDAINSNIAGTLAGATPAMATLTFDGVGHGLRKGASKRSSDSLVFNVINPRGARDNHLQGAMDVIEALRIAQTPQFAVTGVGNVKFDPAKTYFFGHSQGSNVGIPGVALSPDAKAAIFSGAGSDLTAGILGKKKPVDAKAGLSLVLGDNSLGGGHPVMVLWQTFFDRIDPVNYDRLVVMKPPAGVPSKHVFLSWSPTDSYAPPATLTVTAQAMQLLLGCTTCVAGDPQLIKDIAAKDARPVTNNRTAGDAQQRTAVVFEYNAPTGKDGHFVAFDVPQATADWKAFLTSLASTGTPNIP
jgi:hypothetical protein